MTGYIKYPPSLVHLKMYHDGIIINHNYLYASDGTCINSQRKQVSMMSCINNILQKHRAL